jgi:serine/threonine-protein kinase
MTQILSPGDVLAGYRLEEQVGRGGMGVVFRAEHLGLGRRAAVKVMSAQMAADDRFRERFKREARLAASIDHPNIVPVYEAGEDGPHLFIAMRFVDGTDLAAMLAGGSPLDPHWTAGIITQVAAALDAAHRRGLVHRDVKPANVLLVAEADAAPGALPHAYLTDFGITRELEATQGLTATGAFVGSVQYAAPEQIEGAPPSAASDVYSLGCLAYECLAGSPPFTRDHDIATLWAHVNDPVVPVSERAPGLGADVDAALARALAKDPSERWPTCAAFAAALAAALGPEEHTLVEVPGVPGGRATLSDPRAASGSVTSEPGRTAATGDQAARAGAPAGDRSRSARRRRTPLVLAGLVALGVAAVVLGLALGGGRSSAEADVLETPSARVTLPEGGAPQDLDTLPALPELELRAPAAAAIDGTVVRVGQLPAPAAGTSALPEELVAAAGEPTPVKLPAGEALRYDVRRGGGLLRVYVLPVAGEDWVVLACETPSVAAVEACDGAAAGLRPRGAAIGVLPDPTFARDLSRLRAALVRVRADEQAALGASSRTRRRQAARQLAAAHRSAGSALGRLDVPPPVAAAVAQERQALERLASAFDALAAAAGSGDRGAYQRARERVDAAERARASAQAALQRAGYAPASR